jgi:hypothetical protein
LRLPPAANARDRRPPARIGVSAEAVAAAAGYGRGRSRKTGAQTDDARLALADHPGMDVVAIAVALAAFAVLVALVDGLDRV